QAPFSPERPPVRRYSALNRGELGEARLGEPLDDRVATRLLVVPGQRDLSHEVRVRGLEALMALERMCEPHHAALAADSVYLDRVRDGRHDLSLTSVRRSPGRLPPGRARAGAPPQGRRPRAPPVRAASRTRRGRAARRRPPPPRPRAAAPRQ